MIFGNKVGDKSFGFSSDEYDKVFKGWSKESRNFSRELLPWQIKVIKTEEGIKKLAVTRRRLRSDLIEISRFKVPTCNLSDIYT